MTSITLPSTSDLVQILGLDLTTAPAPGADTISMAAHGNEIYTVDAKYSVVSASQVNGATTAIQNSQYLQGIDATSSVAVSADGNWVYATVPSNDQVAVYYVGGGALGGAPTITAVSGRPNHVAAANGYVYVSLGSSIAVYQQYGSGALGVIQYAGGVSDADNLSILQTSGGTFLYVSDDGDDSLVVYRVNANGTLSPVQTVQNNSGIIAGLANPGEIATGVVGGQPLVYVTGRTENAIVAFRADPNTGLLTYVGTVKEGVGGVAGLSGITGLALTSDGKYLVGTGNTTNSAAVFGVDPVSGQLTYLQELINGSGTTRNLFDPQDLVAVGTAMFIGTGGPGVGLGTISGFNVAQNLPPPVVNTIQYTGVDSLTETNAGGSDIVVVRDVGMPLTVNSNGVADLVNVLDTSPNQPTTINLGTGNDTVDVRDTGVDSNVQVISGGGNNTYTVESTTQDGLVFTGGSGSDTYTVDGFRLQSGVTINGGTGVEKVFFNDGGQQPVPTPPAQPTTPNGNIHILGASFGVTYTGMTQATVVQYPVANVAAVPAFFEGQGVTLNASSSVAPAGQSIVSYGWDLDGTGRFDAASGAQVTFSWADLAQAGIDRAGTYRVAVRVTSNVGTTDIAYTTLTVLDVPPQLTLTGPSTINGGSVYQLNLASSTPANDPVQQWVINWGDGSPTTTAYGAVTAAQHTYAVVPANTPYTIQVTATDDDGSYPASKAITVLYVAPTLTTISGAATSTAGSSYNLTLSVSGPNAANLQRRIVWGDGTSSQVPGTTTSLTHTFAGGGALLIQAYALWSDGSVTIVPTDVAVNVAFVAPTLTATGASSVTEGQSYTLNLSATDPVNNPVIQWTVNWGDGSTSVTSGNLTSLTHVFADEGTYSIQVEATTPEGTFPGIGTFQAGPTVTVNEGPRTITLGGAATVNEAVPYTLDLTATGSDGITRWHIVWGDGTTLDVRGDYSEATHVYAGPQTATIQVTGYDEDSPTNGYSGSKTIQVLDGAPAPTVTGDPAGAFEASPYTVTLAANDPGDDPVTSWTVNWGDGQTDIIPASTSNNVSLQLVGDKAFLFVDGRSRSASTTAPRCKATTAPAPRPASPSAT